MDHSVGKDLPPVSVERFENLPGRGLFATISSAEVLNTSVLDNLEMLTSSTTLLILIQSALRMNDYDTTVIHGYSFHIAPIHFI